MFFVLTVGLLVLSFIGIFTGFPSQDKIMKTREEQIARNNDTMTNTLIFLFFTVLILTLTGVELTYLSFAVNFLIAKGLVYAKFFAIASVVVTFGALLNIAKILTSIMSNLSDNQKFTEALFPINSFLVRLAFYIARVFWFVFYSVVLYLLMQ